MKFLLIALNVLLVAALAHLAWKTTSDPVAFPSKSNKPAPNTVIERKRGSAASTRKKSALSVVESPEVVEKKIEALEKRNVFNTERVPDAPMNRNNARAQQQIRADMSLVGTYTIGDSLGAIILQRLQGNAQQQLKALQQKEYEQYQASATRVTGPKKKAEAAAAGAAGAESGDDPENGEEEDGKEKKVIVMGNPSISATNIFRQHLKVGDTTVNGYTLVEVTRTSAVLTKNSERIELSLLTPSEAGNIARQRQNQNQNNNARNNNNNNNNNNNRNNNNNNLNNTNNNNNNRNNNNARNNNNNNRNNNSNNRNNNNNRNTNRDDFEWF